MKIILCSGKEIENVISISVSLENTHFYIEVEGQPEGEILINDVNKIIHN